MLKEFYYLFFPVACTMSGEISDGLSLFNASMKLCKDTLSLFKIDVVLMNGEYFNQCAGPC